MSSIFQSIKDGDRVALGKAMTLIESDRIEDREFAVQLLDLCQKEPDQNFISFAVSGPPGAGKSTLIETLGIKAIAEGQKVGVITVDPSSQVSLGSILGDKSRMNQLSLSDSAFVRSSPAGTLLGGIGRRSRELISLLTAAGYNLIFLETVGVGQSEHISWQLTDGFLLVIQPGSGDELQGIKRGITELADIIVVNKTDGTSSEEAMRTRGYYQNAIHYFSGQRKGWEPRVLNCSALEGTGIEELWEVMRLYRSSRLENDQLKAERTRQNKFWLSWSLGITAHHLLMAHPTVNQKLSEGLNNIDQHEGSMFRTEFEIESAMRKLTGST